MTDRDVNSPMADPFTLWLKDVYVKRGFVSSSEELYEAWTAGAAWGAAARQRFDAEICHAESQKHCERVDDTTVRGMMARASAVEAEACAAAIESQQLPEGKA